ncbi:MAG: sodium/glutamate symporter [Steroidobacteraceae bacterium]
MLELNLIHTLAFAGVVLMLGYLLRRWVPLLGRLNLPAAVLGGLLVSVAVLVARNNEFTLFEFDTTLQSPLMIAFFTTVGFAASLSMLKVGGPQVLRFFAIATGFALLQNVLGVVIALLFGLHPLFGVLAGSVTLTGGPATGLAFAPQFEAAGVTGAASVAVAMAMAGIIGGALIGSPIGTWLIERNRLHSARGRVPSSVTTTVTTDVRIDAEPESPGDEDSAETWGVLKNVVVLLVAMWAGSYVSAGFAALDITLPAYIGAMLVAAAIRNLDDMTGWLGLSMRVLDTIGAVALSLFLVLALMNLKLWELSSLALPLLISLVAQLGLIIISAPLVFRWMGHDYESAVMTGGFIGFMLGTTANAMAVMRALVERYGAAPRAFLVAPMVGAFFIDFTNALMITAGLNLLG